MTVAFGVAPVAIYRLLQKSAFEPEDIERMTAAYEAALEQLGLIDRNDPITEEVAKIVVEVAQTGEKYPDRICAAALQRLANPDREAG
jgi:hypothetical protein